MTIEAIKPLASNCLPTTAYRLQQTGVTNGIPTIEARSLNPTTANPGNLTQLTYGLP
jgi:hypothetical protein